MVAEAVAGAPAPVAVRVNALTSGVIEDDLAAIMPAAPAVILLPKSQAGRDVEALGARLAALEAEWGITDGATQIHAIATETAASLFGLGTYAGLKRLAALSWGAEDLSAALGSSRRRTADGAWAEPYALARTLCLAGAVAADVAPIDTVFTDFRDEPGLTRDAEIAAADGFTGKLAIHPVQVPIINAAFTPSAAAVARATRIVAAFRDAPDAGVIALDGEMVDRPHLVHAERVLARGGVG